jgi:hypothetical protein
MAGMKKLQKFLMDGVLLYKPKTADAILLLFSYFTKTGFHRRDNINCDFRDNPAQ